MIRASGAPRPGSIPG